MTKAISRKPAGRWCRAVRAAACLLAATALGLAALMLGGGVAVAAAPHIDSMIPTLGPVGTPVVINGTNFGTAATGVVTFNGVPAIPLNWTDTRIVTQVPQGATTGPVMVTTLAGGPSNAVNFTVTNPPTPAQTWYLAEGCTREGFDTYVLMENTTDEAGNVDVIYNTEQYGPIPRPQPVSVPAGTRVTLHVNEDVPGVDVSTTVQSSVDIVCERAMYWGNRLEGHDSIGVTQGSKVWYLAEGCTQGGYETWVLVQNPGAQVANVDVTYMTSRGQVNKNRFTVGSGQRYTINVIGDVGECDVSTRVVSDQDVVCERAMYWDGRRGGHDSVGVTQGSKTWYLAEGTTALGFQTWLLLQNPTDKSAKVDVTYMTSGGPKKKPTFVMTPLSRTSIPVNAQLEDTDTSIEVVSDREVIAERAMYWDNGTGRAGHETVGAPAPAKTVYFAEGSTAWGFETFICIQNPNDRDAEVNVTYMTNEGSVPGKKRTVKAESRITINVGLELPDRDTSIKLQSSVTIMAERPMYWNNRGAGHVSIGWMK